MTILIDRPGSADAPAPAVDLHDTVTTFIHEATHGPEKSGLSATIHSGGIPIEMSASRGWGVQFSRVMPDGRVERRHLAGEALTIEAAAAACLELGRAV